MDRAASWVLAALLLAASLPAVHAGDAPSALLVGLTREPVRGPGEMFHGAEVDAVLDRIRTLRVLAQDPDRFRQRAADDRNVSYVEADRRVGLALTPDDPRYDDQYGPQHVRAPGAWNVTLGTTDRAVCVVDTGVRYTHEDLEGPRWLGGYDFVDDDSDPWDDHGHGTHVTGIAAAGLDNGVGIAGLGNVGFLAAKVLDANGTGTISDVADGIAWCADHGGHVVSISIDAGDGARTLERAVQDAWDAGSLLVAAAGNEGPCTDCIVHPAAYEEVIAVTCTDQDREQCSFSSQGPEAELAAPGQGIDSTCHASDDDYCRKSGTSMSTPHASGVAALAWSTNLSLSNVQLRSLLQDAAQDLGPDGRDPVYGYGLVDANATVDAISDLPTACFDVDPKQGNTSTVFAVDASCSSDPTTPTADLEVRWDWTDDGTWDTDWTTDKTAEHRYPTGGEKTIRLQVRDADDARDSAREQVLVDARPDACFDVAPREGDLTTTFRFDAGCSRDDLTPDDALELRWDWTGDGTWDTAWSTDRTAEHRYDEPGRQRPRLQVRDDADQTDQAARTVTVHLLCVAGTCIG